MPKFEICHPQFCETRSQNSARITIKRGAERPILSGLSILAQKGFHMKKKGCLGCARRLTIFLIIVPLIVYGIHTVVGIFSHGTTNASGQAVSMTLPVLEGVFTTERSTPCPADQRPCIYGIYPGRTPMKNVIAQLTRHPYFTNNQVRNTVDNTVYLENGVSITIIGGPDDKVGTITITFPTASRITPTLDDATSLFGKAASVNISSGVASFGSQIMVITTDAHNIHTLTLKAALATPIATESAK